MGEPLAQETGNAGLPPRPQPQVEPPQPPPGGVDAVVEREFDPRNAIPDPNPDHNPSTQDEIPAETKEREDTGTQGTRGETQDQPEPESPA